MGFSNAAKYCCATLRSCSTPSYNVRSIVTCFGSSIPSAKRTRQFKGLLPDGLAEMYNSLLMEPHIQYAETADGVSIAFWTVREGIPFMHLPRGTRELCPFGLVALRCLPEWR
jgi:hypothetical protein